MATPAVNPKHPAAELSGRSSMGTSNHQKLPAFLVTADDSLWGQLGTLGPEWAPKQVDSIDELIATTPSGGSGAVLWDARGSKEPAAALSQMQLHSERFAIIALDTPDAAAAWSVPIDRRQVVAHVAVPIDAARLNHGLQQAREEIGARSALLGNGSDGSPGAPRGRFKSAWAVTVILMGLAALASVVFLRHREAAVPVGSEPTTTAAPQELQKAAAAVDEKVDALVERAQRAMLDRHYLEPADGSALSLYRDALVLDPGNGEASQGLKRLAEILFSKVQAALDERKFDVALQALESARSISPGDSRLATFDERVASLRAELGPAQIMAALNAQNFDRAVQLIDEAARAKALGGPKLNQLRDEVRRRREQFDVGRFLTLIDTRLQQDRLLDPHNDSAAYYLDEARQAGVNPAALQAQSREFLKRLVQGAHIAIEERRYGDADRFMTELHARGAPNATLASLQHDINAARSQPAREKADQSPLLELARTRLAQGNVTEPENDSALHYVKELRAADPQATGLQQMSNAVQAQILERARAALDTSDIAKAEGMLRLSADLGASSDADALNERLLQLKLTAARAGPVAAGGIPEVAEGSLARLTPLAPQYPRDAVAHDIEGWVELSYTVTSAGKVADVITLNSSPAGIFEAAAKQAVMRLRYKPFIQDGRAISVATRVRVAFRMAAK